MEKDHTQKIIDLIEDYKVRFNGYFEDHSIITENICNINVWGKDRKQGGKRIEKIIKRPVSTKEYQRFFFRMEMLRLDITKELT
jgi:hypothetical protein